MARARALRALAWGEHYAELGPLTAAVDRLAGESESVRQDAMEYIVSRGALYMAAWKIAYEMRGRLLYGDELVTPQSRTIEAFAATPVLGMEGALEMLACVRAANLESDHRTYFEERLAYYSRRERLLDNTEIEARRRDPSVCLMCGKRMLASTQGKFVRFDCLHCDETRFYKLEESP